MAESELENQHHTNVYVKDTAVKIISRTNIYR